jgi:hypothetical protein
MNEWQEKLLDLDYYFRIFSWLVCICIWLIPPIYLFPCLLAVKTACFRVPHAMLEKHSTPHSWSGTVGSYYYIFRRQGWAQCVLCKKNFGTHCGVHPGLWRRTLENSSFPGNSKNIFLYFLDDVIYCQSNGICINILCPKIPRYGQVMARNS